VERFHSSWEALVTHVQDEALGWPNGTVELESLEQESGTGLGPSPPDVGGHLSQAEMEAGKRSVGNYEGIVESETKCGVVSFPPIWRVGNHRPCPSQGQRGNHVLDY
jgi:hypothetical protein